MSILMSPMQVRYFNEAMQKILEGPGQLYTNFINGFDFGTALNFAANGSLPTGIINLTAQAIPPSSAGNAVIAISAGTHQIQSSLNGNPARYLTNSDIYTVTFGERYVHPNGNDSNDGLNWENAFKSVYAALQSLIGSSAQAKIYIASGSYWHPDTSTGLWLTFDSAVYTGSPQWLNCSALKCEFIGVGGSSSQFAWGGQANVVSAIGTPALRLYGAVGLTFRNIQFSDRTELNVDPMTGLPHGDFTHSVVKVRFENCTFSSSITYGTGFGQAHPSFIAGASFWINIRECAFATNGPITGNGISAGGYISAVNSGTNTATLLYQDDMYYHNAVGLKVNVGGQIRTIVSTNFNLGTITFDGNSGLVVGNYINRIINLNEPISSLSGATVTLSTAGHAANYQPGDFVRDISSNLYQVLSVNLVTNQLTFTQNVLSWNTSSLLSLQTPENKGQPGMSSIFLSPDVPGTGGSGGYLYFIEHCTANSGGITYYNGAQEWSLYVNDFTVESDFIHQTGNAVHLRLYGNYGFAQISWALSADTVPDIDSSLLPDVKIDGLNGFITSPGVVSVDHTSLISGPCIAYTQYLPLAQTQLSGLGQIGFAFNKVYGGTDVGRRLAANRFQNLGLNNPADFPSTTNQAMITAGIADPFGGNRAFRVTQNSTSNINACVYSVTGSTVTAGEIIFAGCWCRTVDAAPLIVIEEQYSGTQTSSTFQRPSDGDGEWQWCSGYLVGVASSAASVFVNVQTYNSFGAVTDYYGVVVYRFSANTMSTTELAEFSQHSGPFPSSAPANSLAPMVDLALSKHLTTYQESIQTNTHPSIVAGANAGSSPTLALSANAVDISGSVSITTGAGSGIGELAVVTFASPFVSAPKVILTPSNLNAAGLQYYNEKTVNNFGIKTKNAPVDGTLYTFDYFVIG